MTPYTGYSVLQRFGGDSTRDVRRVFSDILTAREAFGEAVASQKAGDVILFGQRADEPEDFSRLNNLPDQLDYHDFDHVSIGPRPRPHN